MRVRPGWPRVRPGCLWVLPGWPRVRPGWPWVRPGCLRRSGGGRRPECVAFPALLVHMELSGVPAFWGFQFDFLFVCCPN